MRLGLLPGYCCRNNRSAETRDYDATTLRTRRTPHLIVASILFAALYDSSSFSQSQPPTPSRAETGQEEQNYITDKQHRDKTIQQNTGTTATLKDSSTSTKPRV